MTSTSIALTRAVVVRRPSDYELLLARHATRDQARFFLASRRQDLAQVEEEHARLERAVAQVLGALPPRWRRARVGRDELDRFLFEPDDVVIAVGQDGLVANVAKYLTGQVVIGVNPLPGRFDGILVRHRPERIGALLDDLSMGRVPRLEARTMVEASLDDGQRILALNEVFVGHRSHQSARYRVRFEKHEERQSSSGLIVCTGTGASGWARSISGSRASALPLPKATEAALAFFVREAWPSKATGTTITQGLVRSSDGVEVVSEMNEGGVVFGDGIEGDYLEFGWGRVATVSIAQERLMLAA